MPPEPPTGTLPLDPAGGPPFPDTLCPHLQIQDTPLVLGPSTLGKGAIGERFPAVRPFGNADTLLTNVCRTPNSE